MSSYKKTLAVFLIALVSLFQSANAQIDTFYYTWGPIPKQDASFSSKATISGFVKDAQGNPLAEAEIFFEETLVTKSDAQGKFEFEKSFSGYPKTRTLLIKHPSMNDVIRTYHPTMMSTTYDIAMKSIEACCRPTPFKTIEMQFSSKKIMLDDSMKIQLESLASTLRQNPNVYIELTGYGDNGIENTLAKYRQEAISSYLIDEEGISIERIRFKTQSAKRNAVQMRLVK
jgi:hypothetical protein